MKRNWPVIAVAAFTVCLYAGAIAAGLRVRNLTMDWDDASGRPAKAWTPPLRSSIPTDAHGDRIRRGELIFNETPLFAQGFARAKLSCGSCHAEGGVQPFASPVVGVPALFPMYNERAGHIISLKDRIQECFVRSENGKPIDYDGPLMQALVDYINWLSTPETGPEPARRKFKGRGLIALPEMQPNPEHGAQVYAQQCAGCHGEHGEGGGNLFPPVWGPDSFNDGAGMNGVKKMAAFVQHNMPQNRMGILSPQEAYDVAGFLHAQPRPAFNPAYKKF